MISPRDMTASEIYNELKVLKKKVEGFEARLKDLQAECKHEQWTFVSDVFDPCQSLEEWKCTLCKKTAIKRWGWNK
jgi:predicted Zn-ribbon and HTH transcriptional regulator